MKTRRFLWAALVAATVALLVACDQPENVTVTVTLPAAEAEPETAATPAPAPASKTGSVTVTLAALGIAGLSPAASPSPNVAAFPGAARAVISSGAFGGVELTFTPKGSGKTVKKSTKKIKETVELSPGTYALAVSASIGNSPVAVGTVDSVVVRTGRTATATVNLKPAPGGADGVFGYDLTLPEDLMAATLTLTNTNDNSVESVDLLATATSAKGRVENLPPGEYQLGLLLVQGAGVVKANETVYVYSGLESSFKRDCSSAQFVKGIEAVWALLNSQPPGNDADHPYKVNLSGFDLATDISLAQVFYNLNLANRYVDLDISGCTMGGVTVFDPGTTNTGESWIVSLTLPDAATSIKAGDYYTHIFRYFTALKSVTGKEVITIGQYAFYNCKALTTVAIPKVASIDDRYVFANCEALTTIDLSKVTSINGFAAFEGCKALTTVTSPATSIGEYVFSYCEILQTVDLPNAISIGRAAFQGCEALTEISLPSATHIGLRAFYGTKATALTVTLGLTAPTLGELLFLEVISAKPVTVKVPFGATGYGSSPTDTATNNWGNAFRGKGWDGINYLTGMVNANIDLTIEYEPAP
jgi:hypothetical protein